MMRFSRWKWRRSFEEVGLPEREEIGDDRKAKERRHMLVVSGGRSMKVGYEDVTGVRA